MRPVARIAVALLAFAAVAQAPPLSVTTESLPRAIVNHAYGFKIETAGGVPPLAMEVVGGKLPPGLQLDPSGWITGVAKETGSYAFAVEVKDAAMPPHAARREFTIRVLRPLAVAWKRAPEVREGGIYGAVEVSNTSETAADVTVIIVAVNEYGKAFALGYDRGLMKAGAAPETVTFGSTLPAGTYSVRVDAVGEVAATQEIWRAALETTAPMVITTVP